VPPRPSAHSVLETSSRKGRCRPAHRPVRDLLFTSAGIILVIRFCLIIIIVFLPHVLLVPFFLVELLFVLLLMSLLWVLGLVTAAVVPAMALVRW